MPLLSENPMWEAFGQRALLTTGVGGADFGECLATMREVGDDGDAGAWYEAWTAIGMRLADVGADAAGRGHSQSAHELFMRASTYHRTAYFPLYGSPVDHRLVSAFDQDTECFRRGAALAPFPIEAIEIEAEFGSMPAYVVRPDDSGAIRPTIVQTNGYDSNIQEMFFSTAPAALSRGYNWIGFDGPGQGRCLIRDGIHLRPDWENVVRPAIDRVLELDFVDRDRVVLAGWSLGGFLAPRAAAFEDRIAALVADPGQWDLGAGALAMAPISDEDKKRFPDVDPEVFDPMERWLEDQADPFMRWRLAQRGFWVHGVDSLFELFKALSGFEVSSVAGWISCPTLLTMAENDPIAKGAPQLYEAIDAPKLLVRFSEAEGAGGHCEAMARSLYHQRVLDWLDETV
jgi:pimeloyl-ACP methyl ester carboxylesterase